MFRDTPVDRTHFVLADQDQVGAVWGLAYADRTQAVYAAAFHKRAVDFGPGGPGAIYRIDVAKGDAEVWVTVPNVGPDRHSAASRPEDPAGAPWAGKTSLGDVELNADEVRAVRRQSRRSADLPLRRAVRRAAGQASPTAPSASRGRGMPVRSALASMTVACTTAS